MLGSYGMVIPAYILAFFSPFSTVGDSLLVLRVQFYTKGRNEHLKSAGA